MGSSAFGSWIKRGAATALSWINPAIRFYQPAELVKALAYLELQKQRVTIEHEYREIQKRLEPVRALQLIKR